MKTDRRPGIALANLFGLLLRAGRHTAAAEIGNILCDLMECLEDEPQDTDDAMIAANVVGLRGDVTPEQPVGGLAMEPFFFDHSSRME